jgi:5-methylcytosine-specific restriction protein B
VPESAEVNREAINQAADQFMGWADEFGGQRDTTYVWRKATEGDAIEKGASYFGVIEPSQAQSGPYQGLSLVVFPCLDGAWLVSLVVGTAGFGDDYELASRPGTQRTFRRLKSDVAGFCKSSFTDIETKLPVEKTKPLAHLKTTLDKYGPYILAYDVLLPEPSGADYAQTVRGYLATYAQLRQWPHNEPQRTATSNASLAIRAQRDRERTPEDTDDEQVLQLLETRKYVVLQGAPGTGKTHLAREMAARLGAGPGRVVFTQFHAETSYSDFVWGIRPQLAQNEVGYASHRGPLCDAIEAAQTDPEEPVLLIIDEINRANLATVLGPVFYLFEYQMQASDAVQIEIAPGLAVDRLPSNLYVIATMNTADRSLAIVDFALRRRFAWYTLRPRAVEPGGGKQFFTDDFDSFARIFETFASTDELNLQPGQGYFIAADEEEMAKRRRFELLPLMREYFAEGILLRAREDIVAYFSEKQTGEEVFP